MKDFFFETLVTVNGSGSVIERPGTASASLFFNPHYQDGFVAVK
jgi:hypothetical protein